MHYPVLDPLATRSTMSLRVRFCDTDLMGIVHHANYFAYFEAGRVDWLRRRGVTYSEWAANGLHLPVVDAQIRYRAPALFDDVIEVETVIGELKYASVRFDYTITRGSTRLADGSTRLACVDGKHQVRRLSPEMLDVLQAGEKSPSRADSL